MTTSVQTVDLVTDQDIPITLQKKHLQYDTVLEFRNGHSEEPFFTLSIDEIPEFIETLQLFQE